MFKWLRELFDNLRGNMSFEAAVRVILDHEGGYVNDKRDNGGETKYGISKRSYPDLDIKNLSKKQASDIYRKEYWNKIRGDYLPFSVALVLFDMSVNMGVKRSVKFLQRIVGSRADGILGDKTLESTLHISPQYIVERLTKERIMYYSRLDDFKNFGEGWVSRSIDTLGIALLIRNYDV